MIGHQAPGPDLRLRPPRRVGEQIAIQGIVALFEKGPLAPVAPLRHMMRNAGQHEARKAGHARCFGKGAGSVNPLGHGAAPLWINRGALRRLQRLGLGV